MLSITTKTAVFFILSISISDGKGTLVAPKSQIHKYYLSLWKGTVVGAESQIHIFYYHCDLFCEGDDLFLSLNIYNSFNFLLFFFFFFKGDARKCLGVM